MMHRTWSAERQATGDRVASETFLVVFLLFLIRFLHLSLLFLCSFSRSVDIEDPRVSIIIIFFFYLERNSIFFLQIQVFGMKWKKMSDSLLKSCCNSEKKRSKRFRRKK